MGFAQSPWIHLNVRPGPNEQILEIKVLIQPTIEFSGWSKIASSLESHKAYYELLAIQPLVPHRYLRAVAPENGSPGIAFEFVTTNQMVKSRNAQWADHQIQLINADLKLIRDRRYGDQFLRGPSALKIADSSFVISQEQIENDISTAQLHELKSLNIFEPDGSLSPISEQLRILAEKKYAFVRTVDLSGQYYWYVGEIPPENETWWARKSRALGLSFLRQNAFELRQVLPKRDGLHYTDKSRMMQISYSNRPELKRREIRYFAGSRCSELF